jgi:hypothetical protein
MTFSKFGMANISYSFKEFAAGRVIVNSAKQCPAIPCEMCNFTAGPSNTGVIYVGGANVSSVQGIPLQAGESTGWIPIENLNLVYIARSVAADVVNYMIVR